MKKLVLVWVLALMFPIFCDAFTVNITADMHAGKESKRDKGDRDGVRNITYPKKWKGNFKNFLNDQADLYLILGDNINGSKKDYKLYRDMRVIVGKSKREALFVKGNHDKDKNYKYLSASKYYVTDKDNWRIIVLDTNERGKFSQTQLDWFKEALKTDKKVLVAMHEPPFVVNTKEPIGEFESFLEIVKENENIKYVLSGHSHLFESKTVDGYAAEFITVQPLTLKGSVGKFLKLNLE
jgi:predicted phosphodiesterase